MISFLKQYKSDIFSVNLGSFFIDLYQLPDGNWKFNKNDKTFSQKELMIIMDNAFYECLNINGFYRKNYMYDYFNIILTIANHSFFEGNIFQDMSKEEIGELIAVTGKSNQELLYIREFEPERYINEFKRYYNRYSAFSDILTEDLISLCHNFSLDLTNNVQCSEYKFFWFIDKDRLTNKQIDIINILKLEGFIGEVYQVLDKIVNYFYELLKQKRKVSSGISW